MRVFVDACVLYPTVLRGIVLAVAQTGSFTPLWSDRVVEEWRRAAAGWHPDQGDMLAAEIALFRAEWADGRVPAAPDIEAGLSLPDRDDEHVLAGALRGDADVLLTLNLRDFPGRTLARHGLRAAHPDPFLLALFEEAPDPVGTAIRDTVAPVLAVPGGNLDLRGVLKKSRLPRLGRALAKPS